MGNLFEDLGGVNGLRFPLRIEVDIDCGNCNITDVEREWFKQEIEKMVKSKHMEISNIRIL